MDAILCDSDDGDDANSPLSATYNYVFPYIDNGYKGYAFDQTQALRLLCVTQMALWLLHN